MIHVQVAPLDRSLLFLFLLLDLLACKANENEDSPGNIPVPEAALFRELLLLDMILCLLLVITSYEKFHNILDSIPPLLHVRFNIFFPKPNVVHSH